MREEQSHFEEVFLPHLDRAYNLARWLTENDQDAQAIVQEAYRQARLEFENFRKADPQRRLLTIVRQRVHAWIQEGEKRSKVIPQTFMAVPSARPKGMVARSEEALCEALSRLPIEFREVLVLREIEGWTYTQLASALGIPRPMVVHRLSLARQSLRQELSEAHRRE
jgi:RNA polymerase sigma factor (sigma-70 family)